MIKSKKQNITKIEIAETPEPKMLDELLQKSKNWYLPNSGIWNERYIEEKKEILTKQRTNKEFKVIKRFINSKSKDILDAPCGFGRLSSLLAKDGYSVTGVDINSYFIDIAKKEATQKKLKIDYKVKNLMDYQTKKQFDAVLNIFTSIGYLESEEENELFIKKLCDLVKKEGILIIETINPYKVIKSYNNKEIVISNNGTEIQYRRFYDYRNAINLNYITEKRPDHTVYEGVNRIRIYFPHELINICKKFGMSSVDVLDGEGKQNNVMDSSRMWLIFKKN